MGFPPPGGFVEWGNCFRAIFPCWKMEWDHRWEVVFKWGQVTLDRWGTMSARGVTAILPHDGNIFQGKVPAGD